MARHISFQIFDETLSKRVSVEYQYNLDGIEWRNVYCTECQSRSCRHIISLAGWLRRTNKADVMKFFYDQAQFTPTAETLAEMQGVFDQALDYPRTIGDVRAILKGEEPMITYDEFKEYPKSENSKDDPSVFSLIELE
jgi:hypothetical protein